MSPRELASARAASRDDAEELVRHKRERWRKPRRRAKAAPKTPPPRRVYVCLVCGHEVGVRDSFVDCGAGTRRHVVCP